jgi:hypothetical protein
MGNDALRLNDNSQQIKGYMIKYERDKQFRNNNDMNQTVTRRIGQKVTVKSLRLPNDATSHTSKNELGGYTMNELSTQATLLDFDLIPKLQA